MTREEVAKILFDAMSAKVLELAPEGMDTKDVPDWNDQSEHAQEGREVFLAMADAVLNMKANNGGKPVDAHGRLVSQ